MRFLFSLLFLLTFTAMVHAKCDSGEAVLRIGFADDAPGSPRQRFAKTFAEAAGTALQGKACVLNVASTNLYDEGKVLEAVRSGKIQLALPRFGTLAEVSPKLAVFSLPFAFRDVFALQRFVETPAYAGLLQPLSAAGVAPLGVLNQGFAQLAASKPVHGPQDARGLSFRRSDAPDLASRPDLMGANTADIADGDLAKALAEKQIEALTGPWSFFVTNQTAMLAGVTETNHRYGGYLLVISKELWDSFDEDIRGALIKSAAQSLAATNTATLSAEKTAMDTVIQSGKPVHAITDKQREAWLSTMRPMWRDIEGDTELMRALGQANAMP